MSSPHKRARPASAEDGTAVKYTDDDPRIARLVTWFRRIGGRLNPLVRIVQDDAGSFHAISDTSIDVPLREPVAVGPLHCTLSYLNLDHSQERVVHIESPLRRLLGKLPNHVLTYLVLVEQRALGEASPWSHYIACLPRQDAMTTPPWFSAQDAMYMKGTPVYNSLQASRDVLRAEWENARSVIAQSAVVGGEACKVPDFNDFLWAVTIITSRAFISHEILPDLPKSSLLFPVIDLLDHSPDAKAEWVFDRHSSFTLKLLDPVKAGAELFNNYGPKHNGELLYGYGFAIPNNPVEQVHFKIGFSDAAQTEFVRFFKPEFLPFDMDPASCAEPPSADVLLRPRHCALARHRNRVPCLAACPPQYVFLNYVAALRQRRLEPGDVENPSFPGARIALATLKPYYAFVRRRCADLGVAAPTETAPRNEKQRFAAIYRDCQVKVTHNLFQELGGLLGSVRVANAVPSRAPAIITTSEALLALKDESEVQYENTKLGLRALYPDFDVHDDVRELIETGEEYLVWAVLLIVFYTISLTTTNDTSLIKAWIHDLLAHYPLQVSPPLTQEGHAEDEESSIVDQVLHSAAALEEEPWTGVADLGEDRDAVVSWAMHVVRAEMIEMPDLEHPEWDRHCLYMCPGTLGGLDGKEGEEWILRDVDVGCWWDG